MAVTLTNLLGTSLPQKLTPASSVLGSLDTTPVLCCQKVSFSETLHVLRTCESGGCSSTGDRPRVRSISIKIDLLVIYATSMLFSAIKMDAFGLGCNLSNRIFELFLKN